MNDVMSFFLYHAVQYNIKRKKTSIKFLKVAVNVLYSNLTQYPPFNPKLFP